MFEAGQDAENASRQTAVGGLASRALWVPILLQHLLRCRTLCASCPSFPSKRTVCGLQNKEPKRHRIAHRHGEGPAFHFRAAKKEESSPFLVGIEGVGVTQMNLIWQLSFFHKIDLIVRFRLPGVRIRGHEED
jgi:hypothetical protein